MPLMDWKPAWLALATIAGLCPAQELDERARAAHLLSRLTYGPRPGEVDRVVEIGVDAWLDAQFELDAFAGVESRLDGLPSLGMTSYEVFGAYVDVVTRESTGKERVAARRKAVIPRDELLRATALRAVFGEKQVAEVLVDFWRNHFNVSYTKDGAINQLITEWDAAVLRRHGLGNFEELLLATAHSPAMLFYLDNAVSRRPPSDQELAEIEREVRQETGSREAGLAAAELARLRGVNENYARELLELHTFGVDNGYDQEDVVALAEILTGWTWRGGPRGDWAFFFNEGAHVAGSKRFLRERIQGDALNGKTEGDEALDLLAGHKRTAEFVARKLCQRLVRDDPPEKLVTEVAASLRRTDGDIAPAIRTLVAHREFWSPETVGSKIKTPQEFVYSALRATGAEVTDWDEVLERLFDMNQPIYHCDDPTGWSDLAEAWLDPGILAQRWSFALDLANDDLEGVRLPSHFWDELSAETPIPEWSRILVDRLIPAGIGTRTQYSLDNLVAKNYRAEPETLRTRLLALVLGCPEFQRQ